MKCLVGYCVLSLALAIGSTACAHHQVSKKHALEVAASVAVIAGVVALAASQQCGTCNIGIEQPAAIPPR